MSLPKTVEYTLDNGLKVLLMDWKLAPIASCFVWYRVGARNERPGITGISHWCEHMLFKGGKRYGKGEIFGVTARLGGSNNGFTSEDFTAYYETVPAEHLEVAMDIEADRMVNAVIDPDEVASERTVIISEREGAENSPEYLLYELMSSVSYTAHPYRWGVLGYKDDLRAITRDDLYTYYKQHYAPNNAVLIITGDFDEKKTRKLVDKYFADLEPVQLPGPPRSQEPRQLGERRCELHHPGPTNYVNLRYHIPAFKHEDTLPLEVAVAILSGGTSFAGGGSSGYETSRLYKALVDSGIALYAGARLDSSVDPGTMGVYAALNTGKSLKKLEKILITEVERLAEAPPTKQELASAKKQLMALHSLGSAGPTDLAELLGYFEMLDSWERAYTYLDEIASVTGKQVQEAAGKYLNSLNRTVGIFYPSAPSGDGTPAAGAAAMPRRFYATGGKRKFGLKPERTTLSNGIKALAVQRADTPAAVFSLVLPAGEAWDTPQAEGLASFTSQALMRGTTKHSYQELFEQLSGLGASLDSGSGKLTFRMAGKCLAEDSAKILNVAREFLAEPSFPAAEISKLKVETLTGLAQREQNTRYVASKGLARKLYPEGHAYWLQQMGEMATVEGFTRAKAQRFWEQKFGPEGGLALAIGDLPTDQLLTLLEKSFGKWRKQGAGWAEITPLPALKRGSRQFIEVPGKTQSDLAIGFRALDRRDPDYYALLVGTHIYGRHGLYGRIGKVVRDEGGMAYYCYANLSAGFGPAQWTVMAGVNPANVERAIEGILSELARIRKEPVTDEELSDARSNLIGTQILAMETHERMLGMLEGIEFFQLGDDYLERFPSLIEAVTKDQIMAVMSKYLPEGKETIVIAGPKAPQS